MQHHRKSSSEILAALDAKPPMYGLNNNPSSPTECFAFFKYALDAQIFADISNNSGASRCYAWDLATGEQISTFASHCDAATLTAREALLMS